MKPLMIAAAMLVALATATRADWQQDYGALLKKYVTQNGVRYSAWKANHEDMTAIQRVVDGIASQSKGNDLPFYINAYNAWILHEALEKYPTKSVKDPLFTFFTGERIRVAGEKMSFNHLEKDIIRAKFKEPRVHFALNCASRSCPPLLNEPYGAGNLDAQFEKVARSFLNSDRGVMVTNDGVALSKIFDWYKEDFGGAAGEITFINKRRTKPIPQDAKISYQEYNWNLNEAK